MSNCHYIIYLGIGLSWHQRTGDWIRLCLFVIKGIRWGGLMGLCKGGLGVGGWLTMAMITYGTLSLMVCIILNLCRCPSLCSCS